MKIPYNLNIENKKKEIVDSQSSVTVLDDTQK